jgi:hypothetical protein
MLKNQLPSPTFERLWIRRRRAKIAIAESSEMSPIKASVTHIDLHDSGLSWIEVELDVPGQCERIELDLEKLGPSAYAPPLLNSPAGLRRIWITNDSPPAITLGETIWAKSFTKGEDASD